MKTLLFLALVFILAGCAGSAADTDFRRKVSSAEVTGTGGATPDGAVTAGAGAKFTFRNPSEK